MKIAYGTAQGLEFLHEKADPPVIYRELKPSTILLDEDFNPKLSDIGLAKGDKVHVSSMVMDTNGYSSPEYTRTGQLTLKSDVYSFGVVMLELITGKSVMDTNEPNLVAWVWNQPSERRYVLWIIKFQFRGHVYVRSYFVADFRRRCRCSETRKGSRSSSIHFCKGSIHQKA